MKIKLYFTGVYLFFSFVFMTQVKGQNNLTVKLYNGSQSGVLISSMEKITFSGGNMVINKTDASQSSYLFSDIQNLTFGLFSGIADVMDNQTALAVFPSPASTYILLKNAPEGEIDIVIYGLDGVVLKNKKLKNNMQQIDISDLTPGLYVLKVNNKTFKFMKQ